MPNALLPLDAPAYGLGFGPAVRRGFAKYATFSGRASRAEYWWFALFVFLGSMVLLVPGAAVGAATSPDGGDTPGVAGGILLGLAALFYLVILLPGIALGVRRLHDANFSGWFLLLNLTYVGGLAVLVCHALPANPAGARFDRVRPGGDPPGPYLPQQHGVPHTGPSPLQPYPPNPYAPPYPPQQPPA